MRSHANGNGSSYANGQNIANGPVPFHLRDPSVVDARAMSTTFWDLL